MVSFMKVCSRLTKETVPVCTITEMETNMMVSGLMISVLEEVKFSMQMEAYLTACLSMTLLTVMLSMKMCIITLSNPNQKRLNKKNHFK